jgi:predicted nucleic-acid-binding Zn-ribbon protein
MTVRLKNNNGCINARSELMDRCFKSGDDTHRNERVRVTEDRDKCNSLIDTKKGKYLLYTCSQSDYESYDRNIGSTCRKDDITCSESLNDDPIDCRKIEDKISAGGKCISARSEMTSRCFDGRWNWKRQSSKEADELLIGKCTELLKHKKNKSLCK